MRIFLTLLFAFFCSHTASGIDLEYGGTTGINYPPLLKILKKDWPKHEPPTALNGGFDIPSSVWRVNGGYFIAYDAGEWGGALFFQRNGKNKLRLLLKGFVDSVVLFSNGTYVAAGGLMHGMDHGAVYRIWVDEDLEWQTKQIFSTWTGIPKIIGLTRAGAALISITRTELYADQPKIIIKVSFFEIDADGNMEYLGQPKLNTKRTSESSEPPTRPESKSK